MLRAVARFPNSGVGDKMRVAWSSRGFIRPNRSSGRRLREGGGISAISPNLGELPESHAGDRGRSDEGSIVPNRKRNGFSNSLERRDADRQAIILLVALAACSIANAEPPLYAGAKAATKSFSWLDEIQKAVPELRHERGSRLPMILWEPGPLEGQTADSCKTLLARGFAQHLRLDEKMIPFARMLQDLRSPVIMMEGTAGRWPASLGGKPKDWQHDFDGAYSPKGPVLSCPVVSIGWQVNAEKIRATLKEFKDAGINVDAVWMDWEGDPVDGADRYEQALHCRRCRAILPAGSLADKQAFNDYCWRRYLDLIGAYLAAPVSELFPACSTTNWHATVSSPERPVRNWLGRPYCPVVPPLITASNPVAYGNTLSFSLWRPEFLFDREHVDQFYTHLLFGEISDDAANRLVWTPGRKSVPWVCRWCPDDQDGKIPIMTRERYREVLRHLWLRGIATMQIFNPKREGFEEMAVAEVQDAAMVYDEMLAYRDVLENGTPLCLDVPKIQDEGVLWSGLRCGNRAVVRAFKQGGGSASVTIWPWPDKKFTLEATSEGRTWELALEEGKIRLVN